MFLENFHKNEQAVDSIVKKKNVFAIFSFVSQNSGIDK